MILLILDDADRDLIFPKAGIHDDKRSMLQARFIPRLHELLRSFFTVVWLRRSAFNNDDADMMCVDSHLINCILHLAYRLEFPSFSVILYEI